ncbi:hypothetical protein GCM10009000_008140 [Halobacterium noricense]|uniref:Uncharacterized protein n=1 Tax=Haladaptatus pallidirubidus TaxID=1008152 RepID=A0AAV3UQS9_9EURY
MQITQMVNQDYRPSDGEEQILELFKEGRDTGEPWGRATPLYLREQTGHDKGTVEYYLRQLTTAGWLTKLASGLYEFNADPRESPRK